jgi:hypothetical protein
MFSNSLHLPPTDKISFFFLLSEWLSSRTQTTNVGEDVGKKEPLYTVGGNIN